MLTDNCNAGLVYVALDKLWHRGARSQNPRAPSEIPASAGPHHEGAAAPVWEVHVFRDCGYSKTLRPRGETDIKDVFVTFKELTIFD